MFQLLLMFGVFVGDYIDTSTQMVIHVEDGSISLCREIPLPWSQTFDYSVMNDTIVFQEAVGRLVEFSTNTSTNTSTNSTLVWEGGFAKNRRVYWEKLSDEVDYTR